MRLNTSPTEYRIVDQAVLAREADDEAEEQSSEADE